MAQPPQQPPQNPKPRRITPCYRHPYLLTTTGLCGPCLHERLSLLNPSTSSSTTTSAAAAAAAELRRCKTFSANNCDVDVVLGVEPRRRSCDVRGRNSTLSSLFDLDDNDGVVSVHSRKLGFLSKETCPVLEEEEIVKEIGNESEIEIAIESKVTVSDFGNVGVDVDDDDGDEFEDSRTMKEFIDLEFQASSSNSKNSGNNRKDFKEIAGSFWIAASVFSKKFRKWGKKERIRENECTESNAGGGGDANLGEMNIETLRGRRLRDTQSEVGEYGFGRRSCDTDPRGSIDLGRASIDCGGFGRSETDPRGPIDRGGLARRSCDTDPRGPIECGGLGRSSCDTVPRVSIDCGGFGRRSCDTDPRGPIECGGLGRRSCDTDPRGPIECGGLGRRSCDTDPRGLIECGGLGRKLCDTDPRGPIDCGGFGKRSCDTDPSGPIECGASGRRSCDTDPRGSIDLERASIDHGGYGRRSCDSDPRFSIDIGRASVDCGRISMDEVVRSEFDAPRASWDGYLLGGRATLPRGNLNVPMPMVSVIENAMATVYGFDNRILSEGKTKVETGAKRDTLMIEDGEPKGLPNARVSPAAIGIFNGTKLLITEKELNEWRLNSNLLTDDNSSESFETASKDLASISSSSNGNEFKKCRQWSKLWSIWGLLNRRIKKSRENSDSPSARELTRTQSTSSSRNESKAIVKSKQEPGVLQRNRSARYSPNDLDNGLLRFYLTPLRSRRRNRLGKSRMKNSKSLAREVDVDIKSLQFGAIL